VEHILQSITAAPPLVVPGIGAQDMVISNQVGITQVFRRLNIIAYCDWISPYFGLREDNPNSHCILLYYAELVKDP
jgi:hypothetical protein